MRNPLVAVVSEAEVQAHVEALVDELRAEGLGPEEAEREARRWRSARRWVSR